MSHVHMGVSSKTISCIGGSISISGQGGSVNRAIMVMATSIIGTSIKRVIGNQSMGNGVGHIDMKNTICTVCGQAAFGIGDRDAVSTIVDGLHRINYIV